MRGGGRDWHRSCFAGGMSRHARLLLLAVPCVGTVVFGGTLAVLARSRTLDHRGDLAALAGILAAAGLTMALLGLAWARFRTERSAGDNSKRAPGPRVPAGPALTVIPLAEGQAAVVFDEVAARPRVPPGNTRPLHPGPEAAAAADAIWDAVADVVAASGQAAVPPSARIPDRRPNLPRSARSWARRLGHGLRRQGPGR